MVKSVPEPGGRAPPASARFRLSRAGQPAKFISRFTPPAHPATAILEASVEVNGARFNTQRIEFRYDHIPVQLLQPVARLKAVSLDLAIRGHNIGYLAGAGQGNARSLSSCAYTFMQLTRLDL